jgi:hypothetical protein
MTRARPSHPARWSRALFCIALPLCLVVQSWAAQAHASGARVLLLEFGGRKSDVLRDKVVKSLEEAGNTVVLAEQSSEGATKSELSRLAQRSNADVIVDGRVQRPSMRAWSVSLRVLDADNGRKIGQEIRFHNSWLPGLTKELLDHAASRLARSINRATKGGGSARGSSEPASTDDDSDANAPAVDEPASDEPDQSSDKAADVDSKKSPESLFEGDPGAIVDKPAEEPEAAPSRIRGAIKTRVGVVHRHFDFSDDIYDRLRKQDANIWVYQLQGEVYPFEVPVGDRLGVIARYEGTFSGNVSDSDFGGNFSVIYHELFGGLRARYPLGRNAIGFDLTFGSMVAGLEDPAHRSNMPEVSYTLLRSSLDGDFAFGPLHVNGSAGFRLPLGYGEIKENEWFPRVGGYGVELTAGLEYMISKGVSLELNGSMRRYLLEMNSQPQDAMKGVSEVAGGAVDLYMSGYFGMTFRL